MLFVVALVFQSAATRQALNLRDRGVITAAGVLRSTYDPAGGDPDGWTTDTVQFRDAAGLVRRATVGHHGDDHDEKASATLVVIYDSKHPDVVMSVEQFNAYTPRIGLVLALVLTAAPLLAAVLLLLPALQIRRIRSGPSGVEHTADPQP